jgi:polyisoprenoid-binding protein YceI
MKRLSALALALALVVAAAACSKAEQAPEQPGLPVAAIAAEAPAAAAAADAVVLGFDQSSSKIGFTGKKVTGAHTGSFGTFSGEVRLGKDPAGSSVTLTIDMASVASDNEKLTGHLKSADFFDAATFPQATFTSTSITAGGEGGATHTVKGNLALHGVTKNVAFPATLTTSPEKVTLKASFALDRKAFNINYPGKADDLIKDHVDLFLDVSATPKAAAATPPAPEGTPPAPEGTPPAAPADGAATPPAGGAAPAPAPAGG